MDADTLVPELTMHSSTFYIPNPSIIEPAVNRLGFILPIPSRSVQVVIPLDEKEATFVRV